MGGVKQRVLWIIDGLGHGGAERTTISILEKFDREKFDLRACALQVKQGNPIAKELERVGIPVDLLPIPYLRHPANLPNIIRYLRAQKPDIIHTQLEFANVLGNVAARLLRIPSVSTLHTLNTPQRGTENWRAQLDWFVLRAFCSRVIAVSENARRHHIKYGHIPEEKIITLYNGIDPSAFQPLDENARREKRNSLNVPENAFVFLTVAVLREPKGIQYMLEAMPQIVKSAPHAHYLIVGEGDHGKILKKITASLQIEEHITFAGQRNDIPEILSASDAFVLPTLMEALPTVLIEACAAQKAIVASSVGGIPEIVTDGVNGYLVPPAQAQSLENACLKLIQHNDQKEAMGEAGLQIAMEKFDVRQQVQSLGNLYQELIANGR